MPARPRPTQTQFERYAQALAATVFSDKKFIAGQQLLDALPNKQLNLLVLYRLKERWEDEAAAIRSPFFDYEAQPVRDAQRKFLNIVSQHIKLRQEVYTQLLAQAVQDAWQLAAQPAPFLSSLAEKLARPGISQEQMQAVARYIVYHADLLRQALKDLSLTGRTSFLKGDLHRQLQQIADRRPAGAGDKYLDELSFYFDSLGVGEPQYSDLEPETTEPDFALEAGFSAEPDLEDHKQSEHVLFSWPLAATETAPLPTEELVLEPVPEPVQSIPQPAPFDFVADSDAGSDRTGEGTQPEVSQWEPPSDHPEAIRGDEPEPVFASVASGNVSSPTADPIGSIQPSADEKEESLGERLARQPQAQGLYSKVAAAASENLHSLIAIGDRYMMVAQLFGGDMATYSMAVSHVNGLASLEEALHYLWDEVAPPHSWNPDSDAYKTLEAALRRKFAS